MNNEYESQTNTRMRIHLSKSLMCTFLAVFASAAAFAVGGTVADRFQKLSLDEGLSQTTVLAIHEDSRGELWFGTEDGLNRFDGKNLLVYRHDPLDPASLPANYVRAIAEDGHGHIWLGTEGGGLASLDPATGTFVRYRKNGSTSLGLASDYVATVVVDRQGFVWAGLRDSGLHRLDPTSGEHVLYQHDKRDRSSLRHNRITALAEGRDGSLWVGTAKGVDLFDPSSNRFLHTPSRQSVEALHQDRRGSLWIGTRQRGLERYDPLSGKLDRYRHDPADAKSLANDHVRAIAEDRRGRLWVATLSGIDRYKRGKDQFAHFGGGLSRATRQDIGVLSLHDGRGSALWLGTRHAGLVRWDGRRDSFPKLDNVRAESHIARTGRIVTSFAEDADRRIFLGTLATASCASIAKRTRSPNSGTRRAERGA